MPRSLSLRFTSIPCAYPQDLVIPPPPLPDRVAAALARAADLHNRTGDCTAALEAYDTAAALWRVAAAEEGAPYGGALSLTPEQEMWVWGRVLGGRGLLTKSLPIFPFPFFIGNCL